MINASKPESHSFGLFAHTTEFEGMTIGVVVFVSGSGIVIVKQALVQLLSVTVLSYVAVPWPLHIFAVAVLHPLQLRLTSWPGEHACFGVGAGVAATQLLVHELSNCPVWVEVSVPYELHVVTVAVLHPEQLLLTSWFAVHIFGLHAGSLLGL